MEVVKKNSKKVEKQIEAVEQVIDQARLEEAQRNFDTFSAVLNDKKYNVKLDAKESLYVIDELMNKISWIGYESYAVKEVYEAIVGIKSESNANGEFVIDGDLKAEVIEAMFFFIKKYEGKGWKEASIFKNVADGFAVGMNAINEDRQTLRDISLELIAAEQGIEVEKVREQYSAQPQM